MATVAELQVRISADPKPLSDGLNVAKKTVKQTSDALQSSFGAGPTQAIQGTTMAVTNFNRIVQDAPFGIIGISNNLEPMIQSFNQLRATTGSTGKALKTLLVSAFTGPGALITAVSLASTALVVFSQRMRGAGGASEKAKAGVESFNSALQDQFKIINEIRTGDDLQGRLTATQNQLDAQKNLVDELEKALDANDGINSIAIKNQGAFQTIAPILFTINKLFGTSIAQHEEVKILSELLNKAKQDQVKLEGELLGLQIAQGSQTITNATQQANIAKAIDGQSGPIEQGTLALVQQQNVITDTNPLLYQLQAGFTSSSSSATTLSAIIKGMGQDVKLLDSVTNSFVNALSAGVADAILSTGNLLDNLKEIGRMLGRMALQIGLKGLLGGGIVAGTGFFGSGGGLFGSILGGLSGTQSFNPVTPALTGQSVNVGGQFTVRGQDLVLALDRTNQFIGR